MKKPLSLQMYTLRNLAEEIGTQEVLRKVAAAGYQAVEGSGGGMTDAEYRAFVNDLGMHVSSAWGDLSSEESVKDLVQSCKDLGTRHAVAGLWIQHFDTMEAIETTSAMLNAAIPILKSEGIDLSLHNHWIEFEMLEGKRKIDHVLERVPDLLLELDLYWCSNFGEWKPAEIAHEYRERARLLHVKDGSMVRDEPMVAVGSGQVEIAKCLNAIDPAVTAYYIVELDACATDMMTAVEDSAKWLKANGFVD